MNGSKDSRVYNLLDKRLLQMVFATMQSHYGTLWVNQVGGFDDIDGKKVPSERLKISFQVWGKKLSGLSQNQIEQGLDNLPENYPPSPPSFKKLCTGIGEGLSHNTAAYKQKESVIGIEMSKELKQQRKQAAHKWREEIKKKFDI